MAPTFRRPINLLLEYQWLDVDALDPRTCKHGVRGIRMAQTLGYY